MYRADAITLIRYQPDARGLWDTPVTVETEVPVLVSSVGMNEVYEARSVGLMPEIRFTLRVAEDYDGQRQIRYKGVLYKVLRTYQSGDGLEITCERWESDV